MGVFNELIVCDAVRAQTLSPEVLAGYCGPDPTNARHLSHNVWESYTNCRDVIESYNGTLSCYALAPYNAARSLGHSPAGAVILGRVFWEGLVWLKYGCEVPTDQQHPVKSLAKRVFVLACGGAMAFGAFELGGVPAVICGVVFPVLFGKVSAYLQNAEARAEVAR